MSYRYEGTEEVVVMMTFFPPLLDVMSNDDTRIIGKGGLWIFWIWFVFVCLVWARGVSILLLILYRLLQQNDAERERGGARNRSFRFT